MRLTNRGEIVLALVVLAVVLTVALTLFPEYLTH